MLRIIVPKRRSLQSKDKGILFCHLGTISRLHMQIFARESKNDANVFAFPRISPHRYTQVKR